MNGELLKRHFERMGAHLEIEWVRPQGNRVRVPDPDFTLDVRTDKRETFVLSVHRELADAYEFSTLDVKPRERHLVLLAKTELPKALEPKQKFLCGHDERHWFIAALPQQVTTVRDAFEALLPEIARANLGMRQVRGARRWKRRNQVYVRQGEWFFVPERSLKLGNNEVIHKHEPIRRGHSKPHRVEQVVRRGGVVVYVSPQYPNGLTEAEHARLIAENPREAYTNWQVMVRGAEVYARGYVRHPDHRTIVLPGWHRVLLNQEAESPARQVVMAFLD